jgi:hypothetical protein
MRAFATACCLLPLAAHAQGLVSFVLDAQGMGDTTTRKVQRATEAALRGLSSLQVGEGPALKASAPRRACSDEACLREVVQGVSAPGVALLNLRAGGAGILFEVSLWFDGEKAGQRRGEASLDNLEAGLRPALEPLVPAWARKGFGGVRLAVDSGAVVKLDGRALAGKPGDVLPVPAGPHTVDVVFPDGRAVLTRLQVAEGARTRLEVAPPEGVQVAARADDGPGALRYVSYGLFTGGALALSGSLVAGALGKGTGAGVTPCSAQSRDCTTLEVAQARSAQAQGYATTANVLLGVGAGLAATGVVLFIIDVVAHR